MSIAALKGLLGDRLLKDEPLSKYTAARLGGTADYLVVVKDSVGDLAEIVTLAWEASNMPVRVIGGGANILVSDAGVRGLVIVNKVNNIQHGDWHDGRTVSATSGTAMTTLANKCLSLGLAGMEWAISVPGTVGGSIVNNAGAHGSDMNDSLADVVVVEADRGVKLYTRQDMKYDYRTSMLKAREDRRFLVLLATFILPHAETDVIQARMNEFRTHRKETQPAGASLCSIFKNPDGDYAGRIIESVGLKGHTIGHAMVSPVHANFFINAGGEATASDYLALIRHVQTTVERELGVELEPEIELVGEWA